jgi:hypothetical protein
MKKLLIAALVIVAVVGGGYLWVVRTGEARVAQAVQQIRDELGPKGSFTYDAVAVHPLSRTVDFQDISLRLPSGQLYTAAQLSAVGGEPGKVTSLSAKDIRESDAAAEGVTTIAALTAHDLSLPPPGTVDPAAFGVADATLSDVATTAPKNAATIRTVQLRDYGVGRVSTLVLSDGFSSVPNPKNLDHVGFSSLMLSGIDLASIVLAVQHHVPPATLSPMLTSGNMRLELLGFYGQSGQTRPLTFTRLAVSGQPAPPGVSASRFDVTGLHVVPNDARSRLALQSLGMDAFDADLSSGFRYDKTAGTIAVQPSMTVQGAGTLSLGLDLAHVYADELASGTSNPLVLMAVGQKVKFVSAQATWADRGLLTRLLTAGAAQTHLTPEQVRQLAIQRIQQDPRLQRLPDGRRIQDALVHFVESSGTLHATLQPRQPLTASDLILAAAGGPEALIPALGLTVTNTAGPPQ